MIRKWWKWVKVSSLGIAVSGFAILIVAAYFDDAPISIRGLAGSAFGLVVGIIFTAFFLVFVVAFIYWFARTNSLLERDIPRDLEDG